MKRQFSRNEKLGAAYAQGLGEISDMEADHIEPYSSGGATDVSNCQLIQPNINRAKGAFRFTPRKWQKEFIHEWDNRTPEKNAFLLVAIPGSGKTMAALKVASDWLRTGADRRIFIVTPTTSLREYWRDDAAKFGIHIQTTTFDQVGSINKDFDGAAVTYHYLSKNPHQFRVACKRGQVMVVFDEIHHCGDEQSFGKATREAFELAAERLLLSGTPWKTNGQEIPFMEYDSEGYPKIDYRYEYPDALDDGIVRYLTFSGKKAEIKWDDGRTVEFSPDMPERQAQGLLGKILNPENSKFIEQRIFEAHERLMSLRREKPNAAAMAACMNQGHARQVAKIIRKTTGCDPELIISDEPDANNLIKRFRRSSKEWVVSVRQVSEGVDIKRLCVLCYFTNWVTPIFFRQLLGRISRMEGDDDVDAHVFMPSDPRLVSMAEKIEELQIQALRVESTEREQLDPENQNREIFDELYTAKATDEDFVQIGGKRCTPEKAVLIRSIAQRHGISDTKAAAILDDPILFKDGNRSPSTENYEATETKEEERSRIARKIKAAVNVLHHETGLPHSDIHKGYSPRQKDMSVEELKLKLSDLNRRIDQCRSRR